MKEYVVIYKINGIYGRVEYIKYINNFKNIDTILNETKINEPENELYNFHIVAYDRNSEDYETTLKETKIIKGLPLGITEDIYFKMALLKNKK